LENQINSSNFQLPASSFLVIQTAFIGDVILATGIVEKIKNFYPESKIDFLLRRGNETLLENNPHLNEVIIWDKKNGKFPNLLKIASLVRKTKYDYVINLHRFGSSGFITFLSGAKNKIGFKKNPFSFSYTKSFEHEINNDKHEVERNNRLIEDITDKNLALPKLYPLVVDFDFVKKYQGHKYYCITPSSVWFTKQLPKEKWIELIKSLDSSYNIYLLGSASDHSLCEEIKSTNSLCINLAGQLSFMQSAALMKNAEMNFVNDSAPLHIASAMNAPVRAFFCSTIPEFGFGPLSDNKKVIQIDKKLSCRPCGLHGYKACPEGHFKCALNIDMKNVL